MAKKWVPVVVTLAILVAVVLGATVGREALLASGAATAEPVAAPVGEPAGEGETAIEGESAVEGESTVAGEVDASEQSTGAEATAASDALWLADHDATVYTDLGEPMLLSVIADGRPLVVNFWATWCPYCVDEMPDLQELYREYGDRVSFAFVDAADGRRERVEDAAAWLVEQGLEDLPAYYDTLFEAQTSLGIYSYPTTVIVAANGEILTISPGRIDKDSMRGALEYVVADADPQPEPGAQTDPQPETNTQIERGAQPETNTQAQGSVG